MNPVRTLTLILLITFAGAYVLSANAQQPSNEKAEDDFALPRRLTPEQIKRWGELADFEKAQAERHAQAIGAAVNTPVGELSREVHAAVQSTWLALNLARSQKAEWLANLRAEAGCPRCVIVGDTLTLPAPPTP
ncbi:MAG: hypothetical protein JNK38_01165 [Acidobacteria bacterium]|nr:hypothetical protein [Acidobacteriota bacterium]